MSQNAKGNNLIRNAVIFGDFVVLNLLFCMWFHVDLVRQHLSHSVSVFTPLLVENVAMVVAQYFFSTVVHEHRSTSERILRQVTHLVLLQGVSSFVISSLLSLQGGNQSPALLFTVYFTLILYAGILLSRHFERWLVKRYRRKGRNIRNVLFVGGDKSMLPVYDFLVDDPSTGYRVVGYYADTPMQDCPRGLHHKGTLADFDKRLAVPAGIGVADEIYCCLPETDQERMRRIIRYCNENVAHFYYIPAINHAFGYALNPEGIGGMTVFTNYDDPLMNPANRFVKRVFDICFSSVVLLCMLPFLPFIAIAIKVQSPGPVFFKQARTGISGRNFYCYKFRSMHVNADSDRIQATENDPRKFAFGNFMRKTNIDELPQFFNVLIGDMSIVGPRPHMLYHTEVYRKLIEKYMVRHFVKPGITGWAQVTGFRGETKELWQMEERVKRDIWYIENWSVWLDIRIVFKTAVRMLKHDENAY